MYLLLEQAIGLEMDSKVSDHEWQYILNNLDNYPSMASISRELGISRERVRQILRGRYHITSFSYTDTGIRRRLQSFVYCNVCKEKYYKPVSVIKLLKHPYVCMGCRAPILVTRYCKYCHNSFTVSANHIRPTSPGTYCSKKCQGRDLARRYGFLHTKGPAKIVTLNCTICNIEFKRRESQIRKNQKAFLCGKPCTFKFLHQLRSNAYRAELIDKIEAIYGKSFIDVIEDYRSRGLSWRLVAVNAGLSLGLGLSSKDVRNLAMRLRGGYIKELRITP